jgi:NADP-dependent 3-hydroxy acid dehydrogenase YdfG
MSSPRKTAIVTGASQGIGAGIVKGLVERGFNVVANSRKVTQSTEVAASNHVALVDGHNGEPATAAKIVETALSRFKSIDTLVNNAGIFITKPFTDYTAEDFKSLVSTNVEGFLYITQFSIKQMLAQKTGTRSGASRRRCRCSPKAVLKRSPSTLRWSTRKTASA